MSNSSGFNWCGELANLEGRPSCGSGVNWGAAFKGLIYGVLAASRPPRHRTAKSGNNGKRRKVCRDYPRNCNFMKGGQECRKNTRLTQWCLFRKFFEKTERGTISTRLTNEAYRKLLYYLRDRK